MREIKRARHMLQQAALREFPNPNRIGCPPAEVLEAMARRKRPTTEADLHHITHCSPCFATFLTIRQNARKQHWIRTGATLGCALFLLIGIYLAVRFQAEHPATAIIAQWDLERSSPLRGAENQRPVSVEAPQKRGTILIQLPLGSDDGQYEIEIRKGNLNKTPLKRFHGVAAIQKGHTNLPIQMDFSDLSAGQYDLAFRHADASWHVLSLAIR
jgi:hypothetical protein